MTPAPAPCPRKVALLEDVKIAMGEIIEIHNREVEALLVEDFTGLKI